MSSFDVSAQCSSTAAVSSEKPEGTCSTFAEGVRHRIEMRLRSKITLLSHVAFWSFLAFCGLIALGLSLWTQSESDLLVSIGLFWWGLILLEFAVASLVAWYVARRSRRLLLQMTTHPERPMSSICPSCAGDPFAEDECCSAFVRSWTLPDLDRYWSDYAWDGMRVGGVSRGNGDSASLYNPIQRITGRLLGCMPSNRMSMFALFGVLVITGVALLLFMPSASRWAFNLPLFGLIILVVSKLQPQSTIPLCRQCHYPAPSEEEIVENASCSECGSLLSLNGVHFGSGLVLRNRRRRMPLVLIPALLLGFVVPMLVMPGPVGVRPLLGVLPTSMLVDQASIDLDAYPVWNELLSRTWSPEESELLFERLQQVISDSELGLDCYFVETHPAFKAFVAGTWPGSLDPDQIGQIKGMFECSLQVNPPAMPGDQVTLMVRFQGLTDYRLAWYQSTSVLLDGVSINDGPFTHQNDQSILVEEWNEVCDLRIYHDADPKRIPRTHVRIDELGVHRVRVAFWLFDQPAASAGFSRDESGEVEFSPETRWFRRVVLEDKFEVHELPEYETLKNQPWP